MSSRLAEPFILSDFAYAHRGLWRPNGATENSLEAFLLAAENGLGIEFDVRPSADDVPVIFHDATLDRMTSETGRFEERDSSAIIGLSLTGGGSIISLATLLEAWPRETPLLCELKIDGATDPVGFTRDVAKMMSAYRGPAAMMSFSKTAVRAIPKDIMTGQLIDALVQRGVADLSKLMHADTNYYACHVDDVPSPSIQMLRERSPLITYTVTSEAACTALSDLTDSQIFEGFDPGLAKRHILNR